MPSSLRTLAKTFRSCWIYSKRLGTNMSIFLLIISLIAIQTFTRAYDDGNWWLYAICFVVFVITMAYRDIVVGREAIKDAAK